MNIQSISIVVPTNGCINNCKFCVSKMHKSEYEDNFDSFQIEKRIKFASNNGVNTCIITGTGEPLQNKAFLENLHTIFENMSDPFPFPNIELQTSGILLNNEENIELLENLGVNTISISVSHLLDDKKNMEIMGIPTNLQFSLYPLVHSLKNKGFNVRLSINMLDHYAGVTPQMAVVKKFPRSKVRYTFINRGDTEFPEGFAEELRKQIKLMENLRLSNDEEKWLRKLYFLEPTYIDFLKGYEYDSSEVGIIQKGGKLQISIEGYWYRTILWEVPLMALISELYFKLTNQEGIKWAERQKINQEKANLFKMNGMHYADFGTRRRYSFDNQDDVVSTFRNHSIKNENFVGSSNVYFAYKYNITPIGTHAHEWFMFHAAKYGYKMANHLAMENWTDIFRGDLGIALSDTFTTEVFFKSFDKKFAKLYDGIRHDSGDPIEFAVKAIEHYEKLGIDPKSKVIVFSDGLNPQKAVEIKDFCRGKIKCSFGIGTNFTNDVGVKPLNIVIKMVEAKPEGEQWIDTIKLSDNEGKHTGNPDEIQTAYNVLKI